MALRITMSLLVFLYSFYTMAQENIKIPGFGEVPYIKNNHNFTVDLKEYGKFDFTGTIQPLSLSTEATIDQLVNFPGYETMKNLTLQSIEIEISGEGLSVAAEADTREKLGPLFAALKITAPTIGLEFSISREGFEMEGVLQFPEPIKLFHIDTPGTVFKYDNFKLANSVGAGSLYLQATVGLVIKPSDVDPNIPTSFTIGYDLIAQEITGSGAYNADWIDPFGINTYIKDNSIILSGGALEVGWVVGTPTPSKVGIAITEATFFDNTFETILTVAPVEKQIGIYASRKDRMSANDMTKILRDGFGLKVPDIFPDCYALTNSVIQFAPTDIEVDTFKMNKGFELSGRAEVCDLFTGPFTYYFDMENSFGLHVDFQVDAKKFIMNEAKKVDVLKNLVEEIFKDFQIKHFSVDMSGSLGELNLDGETEMTIWFRGNEYTYHFDATLDANKIAAALFAKLKEEFPHVFNTIDAVSQEIKKIAGPAANAAIGVAQQGYDRLGFYAQHGATFFDHKFHGNRCISECVPNRANDLMAPVFDASNNSVLVFYEKLHDDLQRLSGSSTYETIALRKQAIGEDWRRLVNDLDTKWRAITDDDYYIGMYFKPSDAKAAGDEFRRLINVKYQEHVAFRKEIWKRLLTNGSGLHQIQNRWKQDQYIHHEGANVAAGNIQSTWGSAQWDLEAIAGSEYFRIKNAHKGTYLHLEHGKLESGIAEPEWHSAQWKAVRVPGSKFVRIQNRWKGTFLNIETGALSCSPIGEAAWSAHWDLLPLLESVNWQTYGTWNPYDTNTPLRIKNRQSKTFINTENPSNHGIQISDIKVGWWSAHWIIEPSDNPYYVFIKNRHTGKYLHIEGGMAVQCGDINRGWHSAQWEIIPSDGNSYKIMNRWAKTFLNVQNGGLWCTNYQHTPNYMWEIDYHINPEPISVWYDQLNGCGTFYQNGSVIAKHCGWSKSWHSVVMLGTIGNSWSEYKILFYDQNSAHGEIYKIETNGNMQLLMAHDGWANWERISWEDGLIKFELANGYWEKYKSTDNGGIVLHSKKQ